jgi:hypothetical protein
MKPSIQTAVFGLIGIAALAAVFWMPMTQAGACGFGYSGGQGFVPQRRDANGATDFRSAVSRKQAISIVTKHLKQLNPKLHIGHVNDTGPLFEAQVLSSNNEVVQMLGVDKQTGRLVLLN